MSETVATRIALEPLSRSAKSWAVFDAGRNCYGMLIASSVFMPYVATVLAPNAVKGQELVATVGLWSGLFGALLATVLGGAIDRMGLRKPALTTFAFILAAVLTSFWWAAPKGGLSLDTVVVLLIVSTILFGLCEVVHNAMLLAAAEPEELGRASGLGAALGFLVAGSLLLGFLWAFVLPGQVTAHWLPATPLLGLDPKAHEPQRASGPLVAAALVLSLIPLLLFCREPAPNRAHPVEAFKRSVLQLGEMLQHFLARPAVRTYLIARILFNAGHAGNLMFMGIYAAGAFRWGTAQLMIEALVTSIAAAGGGILSGWLDTRLGTKRALLLCLLANAVAFAGMIGVSHDALFFGVSYDPLVNGRPWDGPLYNTWPEWIFAACDIVNTLFLVAAIALSRTMMAKLSPPEQASTLFGLYAFSSAGTAWIAPVIVGLATSVFASQQSGLLPLLGLIALGCVVLLFVNPARDPEATP